MHLKNAIKLRSQALHKQLEEYDPAHKAQVAHRHQMAEKVKADVHAMEEAMESSDMDDAAEAAIHDNLKHIKKDVTAFDKATESDAPRLQKAISLRVKALHQQLEEQRELAAVPKVEKDVANLEENLENSKYTSADKEAMHDNLEHILEDSHKVVHAKGAKAQALKEAISKRMTAFKQQLEEAEADIAGNDDAPEQEEPEAAEEDDFSADNDNDDAPEQEEQPEAADDADEGDDEKPEAQLEEDSDADEAEEAAAPEPELEEEESDE